MNWPGSPIGYLKSIERSGYKVTVPAEIDVKSIREGLLMTQARFPTLGFSLDAVKH